jgi:hypothetical protein
MAATIIWSGVHTKLLTRLGRFGQAEWFIPELDWRHEYLEFYTGL